MFRSTRQLIGIRMIGATLAIVFLSVTSFGLFYMSAGMKMTSGTPDCPFMTHGETLCAMSIVDHISAWQSTFLAVIPAFLLLILAATGAVTLYTKRTLRLFIKLSNRILLRFKYSINRVHTFPPRSLQELFSNGILHPKLF